MSNELTDVEFSLAESTLDFGVCEDCYEAVWRAIQPSKPVVHKRERRVCGECAEIKTRFVFTDLDRSQEMVVEAVTRHTKGAHA